MGQPGHQRHRAQHDRHRPQHAGLAEQLHAEVVPEGVAGAGARDDDAGGGGHEQRRDLGDQAVAHGQQGVGLERGSEVHSLLRHADDEAADDVDEDDHDRGDGVAAHELAGAVHGAVEVGLPGDVFARRRAPRCSSMSPAFRSASMAICLPGMASRVKRAATSAMRPAPLVMTTNWMTTRIRKTTMPTTRLPPTTKWPKA